MHGGGVQGGGSNDGSSRGGSRSTPAIQPVPLPSMATHAQQPLQQWPSSPLLPAPSATAAAPAVDPFAASGLVEDFPMTPTRVGTMHTVAQQPAAATANGAAMPSANGFTQRQLSAFATASFQPFQDDRGDGSVGGGSAAGSPVSGFQRLRQNSIISVSIRPLPSRDLADSAAAGGPSVSGAGDDTPHSVGGSLHGGSLRRPQPAAAGPLDRSNTVAVGPLHRLDSAERPRTPTTAMPPQAAAHRRMPSAGRLERGQSLGAALGAPPQVLSACLHYTWTERGHISSDHVDTVLYLPCRGSADLCL